MWVTGGEEGYLPKSLRVGVCLLLNSRNSSCQDGLPFLLVGLVRMNTSPSSELTGEFQDCGYLTLGI